MLEFLKKTYELIAPVSGKVLDLSQVSDEVFAKKLVGDGIAMDFTDDVILAPADGILTLIFKTNHAFGITLDNGVELLVHIGIDTVKMDGEGFERIVQEGTRVKAGDPIIRIDREIVDKKEYSLITPVVITNMDKIKEINYNTGVTVEAGNEIILTYKIK